MCTYCHKQNLSSKIQHATQKLPDMLPLHVFANARDNFLSKDPKFLAATSNLRIEQNLVRLGRFLHFSQKVVGVTLRAFYTPKNNNNRKIEN